ncbi:DUF3576 domain-containing protein [Ostreiculturibacter nitratireducens]|uniref:DUF3576 domain-containing protein n=1 Tax=Ostreiculturibacter nitratireducens TaxID=3075226 RepID=UPI0031B56A2F
MTFQRTARMILLGGLVAALSACGGGNLFTRQTSDNRAVPKERVETSASERTDSTIWDIFGNKDDPNVTVEVNKYIWQASLEVLNFLPIESVDPFTGVIVTGYGTPPGGGRAYRATVYVQDPALDARSLKVALVSRSGPVSADTVRAVEDAILTRARQLRVRDKGL